MQPLLWSLFIRFAVFIQFPFSNQHLLLAGARSQAPFSRVRVPLHDNPFDLCSHPVVTACNCSRGHQRDRQRNRLAFRCDYHYLFVQFYPILVSEDARNQNACTVTNCIHLRTCVLKRGTNADRSSLIDRERRRTTLAQLTLRKENYFRAGLAQLYSV